MPVPCRAIAVALILMVASAAAAPAQSAASRPAPWHDDPDHVTNRVFRALYFVEETPADVGLAVVGEHGDEQLFFAAGWQFRTRKGTPKDHRVYGGDGRQLPRESFSDADATTFAADLAALASEPVAATIRQHAAPAVWMQNDLMRLARRLMDARANPALLPPIRAAIVALALPRARLDHDIPDTLALGMSGGSLRGTRPARPGDAWVPHEALNPTAGGSFVEIDRKSTRLFDAAYSLAWARVMFSAPGGPAGVRALLPGEAGIPVTSRAASRAAGPIIPVGTIGVLVQGLVAIDDSGHAVATPLAVDLRTKELRNTADLSVTNATTTHDGVDLSMFQLTRAGLRRGDGATLWRPITGADTDMFRDYGTLKYTTVAAQCALCHRRTGTPDGDLAGMLSLRPTANPTVARPQARERRAEEEVARFWDALNVATSRPSAR